MSFQIESRQMNSARKHLVLVFPRCCLSSTCSSADVACGLGNGRDLSPVDASPPRAAQQLSGGQTSSPPRQTPCVVNESQIPQETREMHAMLEAAHSGNILAMEKWCCMSCCVSCYVRSGVVHLGLALETSPAHRQKRKLTSKTIQRC